MSVPPNEESGSESDDASSPTPTVRNISGPSLPSVMEIFHQAGPSQTQTAPSTPAVPGPAGASTTPKAVLSGQQQQNLGVGRPGQPSGGVNNPQRLLETSPLAGSPQRRRPSSIRSDSTFATDVDDDNRSRPRTAYVGMGDEHTPRVGGSQRGMPYTAFGASFGSPGGAPLHGQMSSGGSSAARPTRAARYNTTNCLPHSHPVNPANASHALVAGGSGSMSRSASRARPALNTRATAQLGLAASALPMNDDDDGVEPEDLGAALVKRRQQERQQRRRAKERQDRIKADSEPPSEQSAPPTGQPDETFSAQQQRSLGLASGRSVSRSRQASATRADMGRREPSQSYFNHYPASVGIATPRDGGLSPREELRAPSVYSTDEDDGPHVDERASIIDEVVQELIQEEAEEEDEDEGVDDDEGDEEVDDEGVTLRDRQDAINIEHPFGLPIWKPALYRKSRSITRTAESALHNIPSAAAERHLLPGNIAWALFFGWWLALTCFVVAVIVSGAEVLGGGRGGYGKTLRGLAWYIGWPFGKYVEGDGVEDDLEEDEENADLDEDGDYGTWDNDGSPVHYRKDRPKEPSESSGITVRNPQRKLSAHSLSNGLPDEPRARPSPLSPPLDSASTARPDRREPTVSFAPVLKGKAKDSLRSFGGLDERAPLLSARSKSYSKGAFRRPRNKRAKLLGGIVYWPLFLLFVAPLMLLTCVLCWGMVITIPMAKLNWALLKYLTLRPLEINFQRPPKVLRPDPQSSPLDSGEGSGDTTAVSDGSPNGYVFKRARLHVGQLAPTKDYPSTVLLCTYRAVGLQYYKYTVGGVNIMFINLVPLVFFTIINGLIFLPYVEKLPHAPSPFVAMITSQALIFALGLASIIPLSYFIGMAVASISAQSSIGMGATINATFGSIIEIILYSIALTQGKGRLVEGSIVGSILAGVLLMPGTSMCSGALKRKEQRFNAKSAGVTSTMLIMAIIGTLTPTMFYQTYGSFQLHCTGCPDMSRPDTFGTLTSASNAWQCDACTYEHPDPSTDPFYQDSVKTLMYCCAVILLFSYLVGLWFSLRTHASSIWQSPQQLMRPEETPGGTMHPAHRAAMSQRITPQAVMQHILPMHKDRQVGANSPAAPTTSQASTIKMARDGAPSHQSEDGRALSGTYNLPAGYTPFLESVDRDMKGTHLTPMRLPSSLTSEDFTRAVAVATVSALRHQGSIISSHPNSAVKPRPAGHDVHASGAEDESEGGGHEAPSWSRAFSAGVLLGCTLLYAIIAEILVDVVDVVLHGSGIDEKFLGLTLFALVPNTTEFMNAVSFAMNGNIALSMEIGSAYALQVCLLQIPAMVAFSAFYDPGKMGEVVDTFTLIFPRWDVIAIILSIFLLTYTYIEARSNYHRGSILILAYVVLVMGFYFAPPHAVEQDTDELCVSRTVFKQGVESLSMGFKTGLTKLWS